MFDTEVMEVLQIQYIIAAPEVGIDDAIRDPSYALLWGSAWRLKQTEWSWYRPFHPF